MCYYVCIIYKYSDPYIIITVIPHSSRSMKDFNIIDVAEDDGLLPFETVGQHVCSHESRTTFLNTVTNKQSLPQYTHNNVCWPNCVIKMYCGIVHT